MSAVVPEAPVAPGCVPAGWAPEPAPCTSAGQGAWTDVPAASPSAPSAPPASKLSAPRAGGETVLGSGDADLAPKALVLVLGSLAALLGLLGASAVLGGSSDQHSMFAALVAPLRLVAPGLGRWLRPAPVLVRPPAFVSLPDLPG